MKIVLLIVRVQKTILMYMTVGEFIIIIVADIITIIICLAP